MASDDVIELGSSDEETEPAPKKRKPLPNAMVHIPNKLPGVTIKPTKSNTKLNPASILKGSIGKSVTVTKIPKSNINPFANAKSLNQKPVKDLVPVRAQPAVKRNVHIPIQKSRVGPVNIRSEMLKYTMLNTGINPYKSGTKNIVTGNPINPPRVNTLNIVKILKPDACRSLKPNAVTKGPSPKTILPPGITVKRTAPTNFKTNTNMKRVKLTPTVVQMSNTGVITSNTNNSEVLTVDLDDDAPATSSDSRRQWYLRPEEQEKDEKSQQKNHTFKEKVLSENETDKELATDCDKQPKKSVEKSQEQSPKEASENDPAPNEPSESEQQNNKEPDKTTYIEITIEDSPIKPAHTKKGFKVGAELAITIEDSPVKSITEPQVPSCDSDNDKAVSPKDRNSKKKLEYPKTIEMIETLEIEFEPHPEEDFSNRQKNSVSPNLEDKSEKPKGVIECIDIIEVEESPVKPPELAQTITPKKKKPAKPECKMTPIETVVLDDTEKDEFDPIYQSFINLCFQLENSEDMKKIVEKKIKAYYRQVPKEYTESETFIDMVSSKIIAMKAGPEKMYLYIKDIVDELNLQRKIVKAQPPANETINEEQEKFLYGEESEFGSKRQRQIRKLEKTLKKLHRAIQKLEEQEVDFDDEEDSVYLLTESADDTSSKDDTPLNKEVLLKRYKERMVRVHAKLCQLTNTKMPSEAKVLIDARPGRPTGAAKRLEKWINKKVPIGTPLRFPDFHDVVRCVRDANNEDKLGWNEADVMEEARDLFTRCGKKLQRRRQENEWRLAASRIPVDVADPAEDSAELKRKLEENKRVAAKKETEVFNKYADRQNQLNLEAVEISDKEAEESPVESDEEEPVEETDSLTNKQKRRERLKRLLQEKSKKASDEKENQHDDQHVMSKSSANEPTKNSNETLNSMKDTNDEQENAENKDKEPEPALSDKYSLNSELLDKSNEDSVESDLSTNSRNLNNNQLLTDKVHSLSDDSNKIDSDIDELHLLQKSSSYRDSDSSSFITISDTSSINDKTSSDDRRTKKQSSDVISIENSSYSESEEKNITETDGNPTNKAIEETVDANDELECSNNGVKKHEGYNKCLEDILLQSSDSESDGTESRQNNTLIHPGNETYVNLRDDNISIGETVIEERRKRDDGSGEDSKEVSDKNENMDTSSVVCVEIGSIEINREHQNGLEESIVETASIKSTEEGSIIEKTSRKSLETTKERNAETIEEGNYNRTTSVNSFETVDVENLKESNIKAVDVGNDNKAIVKLVENIVDENVSKTCVKPVENIDNKKFEETCNKPVKNIGNDNVSATCIKPVGNMVDENDSETSVNLVENIDNIKVNETCNTGNENVSKTCIKPDINIVDENVTNTCVKPVENVVNINVDETCNKPVENTGNENVSVTYIKPVENMVDENVSETCVKSVESIGNKKVEKTCNKPVENVDNENVSATRIKPFENIVDENVSETCVKPVESIGNKNVEDTCNKPVENIVDENVSETYVKPVESIGNKSVDETGNKPVENVGNENVSATCIKPVENIVDENVIETTRIKLVEDIVDNEETIFKSVKTFEDDAIIQNSEISSNNEKEVAMDTAMENTYNSNEIETAKKTNSISEAMEVDSIVEEIL